jgi:hypothetical protein
VVEALEQDPQTPDGVITLGTTYALRQVLVPADGEAVRCREPGELIGNRDASRVCCARRTRQRAERGSQTQDDAR